MTKKWVSNNVQYKDNYYDTIIRGLATDQNLHHHTGNKLNNYKIKSLSTSGISFLLQIYVTTF